MVMLMIVVVVMAVMRAGFGGALQLPAQKGGGDDFNARARFAGAHGDVMAGEKLDRPFPDAAGDHGVHPELAQPAREQSRLMRRRGDDGGGMDGLFGQVQIYQREVPAAAEVIVQTSGLDGHGQANGMRM